MGKKLVQISIVSALALAPLLGAHFSNLLPSPWETTAGMMKTWWPQLPDEAQDAYQFQEWQERLAEATRQLDHAFVVQVRADFPGTVFCTPIPGTETPPRLPTQSEIEHLRTSWAEISRACDVRVTVDLKRIECHPKLNRDEACGVK